jgi:hypothetical protein
MSFAREGRAGSAAMRAAHTATPHNGQVRCFMIFLPIFVLSDERDQA